MPTNSHISYMTNENNGQVGTYGRAGPGAIGNDGLRCSFQRTESKYY